MTRIAVIGGGPGGLLCAALIAERRSDFEVELFERNGPDESFGFGVVFSAPTLSRLTEADARLGAELHQGGRHWDHIDIHCKGHHTRCGGLGFSAIGRRRLLSRLRARAYEAGVRLRFNVEADSAVLERSHDLVIAADGLNSATRQTYAESFQPTVEVAGARYIWFGANRPFDSMTFFFEEAAAGWFAVHAYPYDEHTSTFVVECSEETWRRAGFEATSALPPGTSDEPTRQVMQEVFARHLDGAELLANNSRWQNFRTVRAASWCHDRTVLLGDAAHTAHFSVGSGTTMALEDALALAEAITDPASTDFSSSARLYEQARRPRVDRIQEAAEPSMFWWEHFDSFTALPPEQFPVHFLTRSGRVSFDRLAAGDSRFAEHLLKERGTRPRAILQTPCRVGEETFPGRLVSAADLDRHVPNAARLTAPAHAAEVPKLVEDIRAADEHTALYVISQADAGPPATRAAMHLAELLKLHGEAPVALATNANDVEWLATLVLSGRTDMIVLPTPEREITSP
ncbi:FAD-dependent monooxygenase [Nonomuraea sp. NPDC047897]|uniref:FAD-dependent monooxygenase n=1 Tax=Nonomuraea sp. NPDC047897 TaxID=3364346 RepID=UPI00371BBE4F